MGEERGWWEQRGAGGAPLTEGCGTSDLLSLLCPHSPTCKSCKSELPSSGEGGALWLWEGGDSPESEAPPDGRGQFHRRLSPCRGEMPGPREQWDSRGPKSPQRFPKTNVPLKWGVNSFPRGESHSPKGVGWVWDRGLPQQEGRKPALRKRRVDSLLPRRQVQLGGPRVKD